MPNIIIIDDHTLVVESLRTLILKLNEKSKVYQARSSEDAIDLFGTKSIALILLDHSLANTTGLETLPTLRATFSGTPILIVSGESPSNLAQQYLAAGASGFITKASNAKIFISALDIVLAGGTYFPAEAFQTLDRPNFSDRQREVLQLAVAGKSNKLIGAELGIAQGTVKAHLYAAYKILGVTNKTEAANYLHTRDV